MKKRNTRRERPWRIIVSLLVLFFAVPSVVKAEDAAEDAAPAAPAALGATAQQYSLPIFFEPNQGQVTEEVGYLARGNGYQLYLTATAATLALEPAWQSASLLESELQSHLHIPQHTPLESPFHSLMAKATIQMNLIGANVESQMQGVQALASHSNYLKGNQSAQWLTNVPHFAKVQVDDVYPGIDLIYYGIETELEYDFVLAPGADPREIVLGYSGVDHLALNRAGDLKLTTPGGVLTQHAPIAYQVIDGERRAVSAHYRLLDGEGSFAGPVAGQQVAFELGSYDRRHPLIIDPILDYSSFLGGTGADQGFDIDVDGAGNAYVTGATASVDFPTAGPLQAANGGGTDLFVAKFNSSGTALVYTTYIGGSGNEQGNALAVDAAGNAYITGETDSSDFPTAAPLQAANAGAADAFVLKLDSTGSALLYATYLGDANDDEGRDIAIDGSGNAYVTGSTQSGGFPTTAGVFLTPGAGGIFVSKLDAAGSALLYSTNFGGLAAESANGIAVDAAGNAYVVGRTSSADFPTTAGVIQPTFAGGTPGDAFVLKLDPAATSLLYATFLGGTGPDGGTAIAIDGAGNAYVTGTTESTDFPLAAPLFGANAGGRDLFVSKLDAAAATLTYSTYLGGLNTDTADAIALGPNGEAHIVGSTFSTDFPVVDALQPLNAAGSDAFVAQLDAAGATLAFSTYLGGGGNDDGLGIAVDAGGHVYATGVARSSAFPVTAGAFQTTIAGGGADGFVLKISPDQPTLTVTKMVVNDDGGTKVVADFALFVDGSPVTSGVATTVTAGLHTVSEAVDPDYSATIGGDCAADGTITLAAGEAKSCTITNDDMPPGSVVIASCGGLEIMQAANGDLSARGFSGTIIVGTDGADLLTGTPGDDLIVGLMGPDDIVGQGGNDIICGGKGADILKGNSGSDTLYGGAGPDWLLGGVGPDLLYGGPGADDLEGQDGPDVLFGQDGFDVLLGGWGADDLDGGVSQDYLAGNQGNDLLYGGPGPDELFGGPGSDELLGENGNDDLFGNQGADDLDGGNGNDYCQGGPGSDTIADCEGASSAAVDEDTASEETADEETAGEETVGEETAGEETDTPERENPLTLNDGIQSEILLPLIVQ